MKENSKKSNKNNKVECELCGKSYANGVGIRVHKRSCELKRGKQPVETTGGEKKTTASTSAGAEAAATVGEPPTLQADTSFDSAASSFVVGMDDIEVKTEAKHWFNLNATPSEFRRPMATSSAKPTRLRGRPSMNKNKKSTR